MPRRDLDLEPPPRSIARSAAGVLFANPTSTAGGLVMTAMAIAIMTNALALQSGPHPAPLFLGTRPVAAAVEPAAEPREPFNIRDRAMVADIQLALKARGYYGGDVDGLPGPMTSAAIAAYEKASGLPATGAPTADLLEVLRGGARDAAPPPAVPDAPESLDADGPAGGSVPLPRPSPRRHAAADPAPTQPLPADTTPPAAIPVPAAATPAAIPVRAGAEPPPPAARPRVDAAAAPADAVPLAPVRSVAVEPVHADPEDVPAATAAIGRTEPAVPAPTPSPVASDPRLAKIQEALDLLGYGPLKADGVMTVATRDSIRRFEESRNLPPTGSINERFLRELVRIGGLSAR